MARIANPRQRTHRWREFITRAKTLSLITNPRRQQYRHGLQIRASNSTGKEII